MALYILEDSVDAFFKKASTLENKDPAGVWRHFDFKNEKEILGIFKGTKKLETDLKVINNLHQDFFSYFLGQFSPESPQNISVKSSDSFYDFCLNLNTLLNSNIKIYDLSIKNQWIWHEGKKIQIPKKLNEYIN